MDQSLKDCLLFYLVIGALCRETFGFGVSEQNGPTCLLVCVRARTSMNTCVCVTLIYKIEIVYLIHLIFFTDMVCLYCVNLSFILPPLYFPVWVGGWSGFVCVHSRARLKPT